MCPILKLPLDNDYKCDSNPIWLFGEIIDEIFLPEFRIQIFLDLQCSNASHNNFKGTTEISYIETP